MCSLYVVKLPVKLPFKNPQFLEKIWEISWELSVPAVRASPALPLLVYNMDVLFVLSSIHGWFFLSYSLKISLRNGEEIAYNNVRLSRLDISSHGCFMGGEDLQTKGTQQESASR